MKTFHKFLFLFLLLVIGLLPSCKDNILTPVNDTKSADSLVTLISALNSKLVTVNAKDNTLQIQLAKFRSTADSLKAASTGNYSQLVQYTVYVVDGGNSVTGTYYNGDRTCKDCKTTGVDGATVTVYSNGQTYTATSADGRAIFNNLYVAGLATVTIAANGYTRTSYTTYFDPNYGGMGSIGSVSLYSSSLSTYSSSANNISPSYTSGSGSGATFNISVGNSGNVTSITIVNPGTGYKNGDLITFYGGDICDCSGSVTYQIAIASGTAGNGGTGAINASTNVLILPTAGKNVTTYTGQLYINKSVMDDTLGRLYNNSTDAARYLTFISPKGPYHGANYSYNYLNTDYAQNQYFAPPTGGAISFASLTTLTGTNYIYGYPTFISNYYDPNYYSSGLNYRFLPGDIISITYSGLTSFATIDASGKYTMNVPSYQNNPGTTIGATAGIGYQGGGNLIHYQDNYTYLSSTNSTGSTNPTLTVYDPTTYAVTTTTAFYQITKMFDFYPFIELDNGGGYGYIGGYSGYTQPFYSYPGQTVSRNIFFFAANPTGQ